MHGHERTGQRWSSSSATSSASDEHSDVRDLPVSIIDEQSSPKKKKSRSSRFSFSLIKVINEYAAPAREGPLLRVTVTDTEQSLTLTDLKVTLVDVPTPVDDALPQRILLAAKRNGGEVFEVVYSTRVILPQRTRSVGSIAEQLEALDQAKETCDLSFTRGGQDSAARGDASIIGHLIKEAARSHGISAEELVDAIVSAVPEELGKVIQALLRELQA